jgi:nitroreductase
MNCRDMVTVEEKVMSELSKIMVDRHTTREPFDAARTIARPEIEMILNAARWAPTPNNMQNFEILMVDDREQLKAIGKTPAVMSEAFLRENYAQLSYSFGELRTKKAGMLASAFPETWTNPEAWSPDSDYRSQLTSLGHSVQETPLLLVVIYDGSKHAPGEARDFAGHIGLGCVLENMWLMSESLGIGFHVITVFADVQVEAQVRDILDIPTNMKVAFACALGYPKDPFVGSPRVRRDIEHFVHHNRFGVKDIPWAPPLG